MSNVKRADCPRRTAHSIPEITGHVVVRTIAEGGEVLVADGARGEVLAIFSEQGRYLQALEVARAHRVNGGYAVVRDLHDCAVCDPIVRAGGSPHFELRD